MIQRKKNVLFIIILISWINNYSVTIGIPWFYYLSRSSFSWLWFSMAQLSRESCLFFAIYFYEYPNLFWQKNIYATPKANNCDKKKTKLVDFLITLNFAWFWPTLTNQCSRKAKQFFWNLSIFSPFGDFFKFWTLLKVFYVLKRGCKMQVPILVCLE